jgi:hypothetical protein
VRVFFAFLYSEEVGILLLRKASRIEVADNSNGVLQIKIMFAKSEFCFILTAFKPII